jgi:MFS transporter, Spinster family, sphingosine-1-phosphate transporter
MLALYFESLYIATSSSVNLTLSYLFSSPPLSALSSLYFVVTGIQFWGTSYMLVALSAPRSVVNTMFVLCAGTGPTLGVFYGGWIIDKMGGYVGSKQRVISLKICFVTGILAGIFATIGSLVDHFYTFICCLWLILFLGASLLPACTGMLVSVVPRKYRPISSSLSIFVFNIFGYSFSLFLSGYLMQVSGFLSKASFPSLHSLLTSSSQIVGFYFPDCDMICSRKIGFRLVLLWSYWSLLFLFLALLSAIQYEKKRELSIHS